MYAFFFPSLYGCRPTFAETWHLGSAKHSGSFLISCIFYWRHVRVPDLLVSQLGLCGVVNSNVFAGILNYFNLI
jgi:hypothetical protein